MATAALDPQALEAPPEAPPEGPPEAAPEAPPELTEQQIIESPFDPTEILEAITAGCEYCKNAAAAKNAEAYQKFAAGVLSLSQAHVALLTPAEEPPAEQPDHSLEVAALDAQTKLTLADMQGEIDIAKANIASKTELDKAEIAAETQKANAKTSAEAQAKAAQKRVQVKRDQHGQATEYVSGG